MTVLKDLSTPVFAAEGVPRGVAPEDWRVRVTGLAQAEKELSLADLRALPATRVACRLTSVSGFSVKVDWDGVLWRTFAEAYPPGRGATHVTFTSRGGYATTVGLAKLDHPRVLLAWGVGGEPLEPEYGGPLRVVVPVLWGYKSCKWLATVSYTDSLVPGYWESKGYSNEGEIQKGMTFDVNSRKLRPIDGGEVTGF